MQENNIAVQWVGMFVRAGFLFAIIVALPFVVYAQSSIIVGTSSQTERSLETRTDPVPPPESGSGLVPCDGPNCHFPELLLLAKRIIDYIVVISLPIAAGFGGYAGLLYVFAAGNPATISKAHEIWKTIFVGELAIVSPWLAINFITMFFLGISVFDVFR